VTGFFIPRKTPPRLRTFERQIVTAAHEHDQIFEGDDLIAQTGNKPWCPVKVQLRVRIPAKHH
jgi:hypothetical protein